jgi:hypothetical protein
MFWPIRSSSGVLKLQIRKLLCFHIMVFGCYYAVRSMRMCIRSGGLFCLFCIPLAQDNKTPSLSLAHCFNSCSYHTYRQVYGVHFLTCLGVLYLAHATKQGTQKLHFYRLGNCLTWITKISQGLPRWLQSHSYKYTSKTDVCWLNFTVWEQGNLNPPVLYTF